MAELHRVPGAHDAGIEYGEIAADIVADNMAAWIAAEADPAAADSGEMELIELMPRSVPLPSTTRMSNAAAAQVGPNQELLPTAPGAHDAGIEYGVLAADIAADNMAAHIAAEANAPGAPASGTAMMGRTMALDHGTSLEGRRRDLNFKIRQCERRLDEIDDLEQT